MKTILHYELFNRQKAQKKGNVKRGRKVKKKQGGRKIRSRRVLVQTPGHVF